MEKIEVELDKQTLERAQLLAETRHNLTLVTGNLSHYQRIQALGYPLRLDNWRT